MNSTLLYNGRSYSNKGQKHFSFFAYQSRDGRRVDNMLTSAVGSDDKEAITKAVGEHEDRLVFRNLRLVLDARPDKILRPNLSGRWKPYADFQRKVINSDTPISWAQGWELVDGELRSGLIPTELLTFTPKQKRTFPRLDTTGCATHSNIESAAENASFEIIEKNCLVISWIQKKYRVLYRDEYSHGIRYLSYCISFLGVPTLITLKIRNGKMSIGASSARTYAQAYSKSKAEADQTDLACQYAENFGGAIFCEHLSFFKDLFRDNASIFDRWLRDSSHEPMVPELARDSSVFSIPVLSRFNFHYFWTPSRTFPKIIFCRAISPDLLWQIPNPEEGIPWHRPYYLNNFDEREMNEMGRLPFP